MNLAFYATGHGYGHLTRLLAIVREVQRQQPDVVVHIRAPYPVSMLLGALDRAPDTAEQIRLDIGLVAQDSLRHDLEASVRKLDFYFGPEGDALVEQEARWLTNHNINAALLDIPPRAFDACLIAGVPAFGFSNFSWDDIWRALVDEAQEMARFADHASASYKSCKRLFRAPMHLGMDAFPVIEDVPLVARHSRFDSGEIRQRLGLQDEKRPLVLIAFGGEGLRGATLPDEELRRKYHFLITPPIDDPGDGFHYITPAQLNKAGLRYPDLVHAVDVVMSKPGYSTVAETAANQSALILTDRNDFLEGPVINQYARDNLPAAFIQQADLFSGQWEDVLEEAMARLPFDFSSLRTDGAEVVAKRFLEEIGR